MAGKWRYQGSYPEHAGRSVKRLAYVLGIILFILAVAILFFTRKDVGVVRPDYVYDLDLPITLAGYAIGVFVAGYIAGTHLTLQVEQTRMLHYIVENMEIREDVDDVIIKPL